MDRDDRHEEKRPGNVVCFGANSICAPRRELRYPDEWKECCREILRELRDRLADRFGDRRQGWQRIRNLIMRDFDAREISGDGEDKRLVRQDLENWMKPSKPAGSLGDTKFRFVDWYIQGELIDEASDTSWAASAVAAFRDQANLRALEKLHYGWTKTAPIEVVHIADTFRGGLFVLDKECLKNVPIFSALYIKNAGECGLYVIMFYSDGDFSSVDGMISDSYKFFGYMLPTTMANVADWEESIYSSLYLFDRCYLSTHEYAGHNASHCYMHSVNDFIKISAINKSTAPLLAATIDGQPFHHISEAFSFNLNSLAFKAYKDSEIMTREKISPDQEDKLNALIDKYLIW